MGSGTGLKASARLQGLEKRFHLGDRMPEGQLRMDVHRGVYHYLQQRGTGWVTPQPLQRGANLSGFGNRLCRDGVSLTDFREIRRAITPHGGLEAGLEIALLKLPDHPMTPIIHHDDF